MADLPDLVGTDPERQQIALEAAAELARAGVEDAERLGLSSLEIESLRRSWLHTIATLEQKFKLKNAAPFN